MAKRGQPVALYSTRTGDFRLTEETAKRRGLIPDGDKLPPAAARRLRVEGRLSNDEVEKAAKAYAGLSDSGRADFLSSLAMTSPRGVRDAIAEVKGVKLGEPVDRTTALAGASHTEAERPAPRVADDAAPAVDTAALLEGRVGDVTDHLDRVAKTGGDGAARTAAAELLEAERAGKARKSLVAELERRAG